MGAPTGGPVGTAVTVCDDEGLKRVSVSFSLSLSPLMYDDIVAIRSRRQMLRVPIYGFLFARCQFRSLGRMKFSNLGSGYCDVRANVRTLKYLTDPPANPNLVPRAFLRRGEDGREKTLASAGHVTNLNITFGTNLC